MNLPAFQQLPAYWAGVRIVEATDTSIGFVPAVNAPQQVYYPGLGATWPCHVWWRWGTMRWRGGHTFTGKPSGHASRVPAMARVDTARHSLHVRYGTPIDATHTLMWTFGMARARTWGHRVVARLYLPSWYKFFVMKGTNASEDLPVQRYDRLDPAAAPKLGVNDRAILNWWRRLPLKSRDNLHL